MTLSSFSMQSSIIASLGRTRWDLGRPSGISFNALLKYEFHDRYQRGAVDAYSKSVRVSVSSWAAFNPSMRTRSSHVCAMARSSWSNVRVLRWKVDSVEREGEAGDCGCRRCLGWTGDVVGVEGLWNDLSLLLILKESAWQRSRERNYSLCIHIRWLASEEKPELTSKVLLPRINLSLMFRNLLSSNTGKSVRPSLSLLGMYAKSWNLILLQGFGWAEIHLDYPKTYNAIISGTETQQTERFFYHGSCSRCFSYSCLLIDTRRSLPEDCKVVGWANFEL